MKRINPRITDNFNGGLTHVIDHGKAIKYLAISLAWMLTVGLILVSSPSAEARAPADTSVAFLNPSAGSSLKISDKQAQDSTYTLSAWVSNASAVKLVEFEMTDPINPLARPITIGSATAVTPDTYELQWAIPASLTDGNYVLEAIAYGQNGDSYVELDRADEEVTILQGGASPAGGLETVDITGPVRGGSLGMFVPEGRPAGGVVDTGSSSNTGWVRLFYTTSSPGSDPVWKLCGAQPAKKAGDGVGCILTAADSPQLVTAIAAVSNATPYTDADGKDTGKEQPDPAADQSSDATRIATYLQQPTTLALDPGVQKVNADSNGVFPCSPAMKVTLTDQFGDGILGANIDIHASGPTSGLFFEVVALVSNNQAPDKGHGGTEPAENCTGPTPTASNEKEGVHRIPGGLSVKHVESLATSGTDDSGSFPFRLYSESVGTTMITAWADIENDDELCFGEPVATASIGWGGDAVPGEGEKPSECGSTKMIRSITLTASNLKVAKGGKAQLAAAITSALRRCISRQKVSLQARPAGQKKFRTLARKSTNKTGGTKFSLPINRATEFRASVPATSLCSGARSVPIKVQVNS